MCKHTIYYYACNHLATGPALTSPCPLQCSLYYPNSRILKADFQFPFQIRTGLDIEYTRLTTACKDCDSSQNPLAPLSNFKLTPFAQWYIPAVDMLDPDDSAFAPVDWHPSTTRAEDVLVSPKGTNYVLRNLPRTNVRDADVQTMPGEFRPGETWREKKMRKDSIHHHHVTGSISGDLGARAMIRGYTSQASWVLVAVFALFMSSKL